MIDVCLCSMQKQPQKTSHYRAAGAESHKTFTLCMQSNTVCKLRKRWVCFLDYDVIPYGTILFSCVLFICPVYCWVVFYIYFFIIQFLNLQVKYICRICLISADIKAFAFFNKCSWIMGLVMAIFFTLFLLLFDSSANQWCATTP